MRTAALPTLGFLLLSTFTGLFGCGESAPEGPANPALPPIAAALPPHTPAADGAVTGVVTETLNSGGYTYLRLSTAAGEQWAAVPQAQLAVGATATIDQPMLMEQYTSPTLGRTFEAIWFGTLAGAKAAGALPPGHVPVGGAAPGALPPGHAPVPGGAHLTPVATAPIQVERAADPAGATVAELWARRATLNGQPVVVRGQVVKATNGVMGKNWLHVQDGTGSPASGDHDLTVTTDATAAVGDVVTVRGTLNTDVDFGGGYAYTVIMQGATVE